ncbi:histone-lysine N-methyltransferase, H3 lysine-79 specific-like [Papaver somniferum]|uniref:histone-lysine N-methyltransferase, H3 lysine-79 specific-like n=1 Tax=Papaver somniferum TaxID=3469 RepID=UPI000E700146|nr:histone-lysine N-methyltransferase, H3 lysine-79 specific-like [Papaver somniferum]
MKYMNKDRESKSSSICGTGTRKSTRCLQNTVSKPYLRRKATEKRNHTIVDKGQVGSNIATGVKSFTDLLKNAVLPAKRKVPKVKALDLAKETKKQEEEKKKQREMMKEKLERERERQKEEKAREEELNQRKKEEKERQRERLKEEKARQQELIQKRKEVEAQRKEAEMQERKRLREDEKKEKDRKMMRKEPQKKLPAGKEEKELKYRAADEKASTRKGFQDEDMKDLNPEKVKAREECAIGRQTQAKEPSGVHEHSVALKESHSNENAVNCFGQVNEVGSLATGGTLEQSYDISPYQGSDGEEDDDVPTRKVVPSWSRQCCLAPLSCSQQPKNIFKLSSFCDINQVLKSRKSSK